MSRISKQPISGKPTEDAPTFKAAMPMRIVPSCKRFTTMLLLKSPRLPQEKRIVVTAHDAFGYLEKYAYGLTFLAPQGIDTDAEPSAKEVAVR